MPRSPSPRKRSVSPRRDRDRDYDRRDRDRRPDYRDDRGPSRRSRSRSRSPPRTSGPKRPKELSFYKKSSVGSFSRQRDPLEEETAKERMQRRDRGEVPARFGGTREHGVRNTMSTVAPVGTAPTGMGSFKRTNDPLDRMSAKRGEDYKDEPQRYGGNSSSSGGHDRRDGDRQREERLKAMDKPQAAPSAAPSQFGGVRMIEVIANDRMGRKVRVKCLPTDTVGDLKRLIAAQTGTTAQKIQLKKWYTAFKDHVSLRDYEINDGMSLEMY